MSCFFSIFMLGLVCNLSVSVQANMYLIVTYSCCTMLFVSMFAELTSQHQINDWLYLIWGRLISLLFPKASLKTVLGLLQNQKIDTIIPHMTLTLTLTKSHVLSISPSRMVCLLQFINLKQSTKIQDCSEHSCNYWVLHVS